MHAFEARDAVNEMAASATIPSATTEVVFSHRLSG